MRTSNRSRIVATGFSVLAGLLLVTSTATPSGAAASERSKTNSSGSASVSRSSVSSKSSGSTTATRSQSGAKSTRSNATNGRTTATRKPSTGRPHSHYRPSRYYYRGYWPYWDFGWSLGYYPWGYWGRYYPYYPVFPTVYYGAYPTVAYPEPRLGALDLNVKPKKTEVWVDGQLVGLSGKFDGFPGYLWLEQGRHQLVFYRQGFQTEMREVRVLHGAVVRVNLRLEEGEATRPEEFVTPPMSSSELDVEGSGKSEKTTQPSEQRGEPGRLRMSIEPEDASVYLDGRFLGTAKELSGLHAGLLISAGEHVLEIVRPGYRSESLELRIEPDVESAVVLGLDLE